MADVKVDLLWFQPNDKQKAFIGDTSREIMFAGGFGAGKTISGGIKAVINAVNFPGSSGLVCRQTYQALRDTTMRILVDGDDRPALIPPELVADRSNRGLDIRLINGSEIKFRSIEDYNPHKIRSLNLSWIYVDECTETSFSMWAELSGRLRHPIPPQQIWGTTNPNGHDWVWRRFHPEAGSPVGPLYISRTADNMKNLPAGYEKNLRDSMPPDWVKRFLDCGFDSAAGAIWDQWDWNIHVVPTDLIRKLPVTWYRARSMDHGTRSPTAVLWHMVDPDGFLITADEYYSPGLPSLHAPIVKAKDEMLAPGINLGSIIAPSDVFKIEGGGYAVADEYRSAGLTLTRGDSNRDPGLVRVNEWLLRDPNLDFPDWHPYARSKGPDGRGSPRMFVADACVKLIEEIPNYEWKTLRGGAAERQDEPEEPRKKDDHACDALRLWVMSRPRPRIAGPQQLPDDPVPAEPSLTHGLLDRVF